MPPCPHTAMGLSQPRAPICPVSCAPAPPPRSLPALELWSPQTWLCLPPGDTQSFSKHLPSTCRDLSLCWTGEEAADHTPAPPLGS